MDENIQNNNQQTIQNGDKPFKCSGDCLACHDDPIKRRNQWQYCAAQKSYNSMRMLGDMQEALKMMQGTVEQLKAKIEAIQSSESVLVEPIT